MVVEFLSLVGDQLALLVIVLHHLARVADIVLNRLGQIHATVTRGTHLGRLELIVRDVVEGSHQMLVLGNLFVLLLLKLLERAGPRHPIV